jgi:hypothetical protein
MWKTAIDAAEYFLMGLEARLDRIVGHTTRLALGRYAALLIIGVPLAWALNDFHWGVPAKLGLVGGMLLYAIVDFGKCAFPLKPKR